MRESKEIILIGYVKSGIITTIVITNDKIATHSRPVPVKKIKEEENIVLFADLVNKWKKKK